MHIFITGIAGFIGFHLAKALKARGDHVSGCDNFNNYYDPELKRARAKNLLSMNIDVQEADILDTPFLEKALQGKTHLAHLAAQAGVRYSLTHPEAYGRNNLDGFISVLEALRHHPQVKCVYASSSSVYGLNKKIPFKETDPTDQPANLYGATKKSNELLAHSYHHLFGLSLTGLRFFTVYGPWGRPDMAYFSFTRAILEETPIPLYNKGNMQRDFTYIDDIVEGTLAAIDLGAPFELFNLGNNKPEEIRTLIALLEQKLGKKARLELLAEMPGEIPITYADITKSQQHLNFQPKTNLNDGLNYFVDWYNKTFITTCSI